MRAFSASCATISPCTRYVVFGARGNVRSQRMISPASACADMPSILSILAWTGHVLSEDLHVLCAVNQLAAARAGRLESDEEHGVSRVRQAGEQVVHDSSARRHAARRDDHGRRVALDEGL